ncbi:MAG: hypothetical protein Q7J47_07825 [Azoarcus sp.]|nr:hypothetical protein [Azoarcus sp.]
MRCAAAVLFATAFCAGAAAGVAGEVAMPAVTDQTAQGDRLARQAAGQGGYCDPSAVHGPAPGCRARPATMAVRSVRQDANPDAFLLLLQILRSPK